MKRLILLCLFLVACVDGTYTSTDYHYGTQGVVLEFFDGYPETEVYEQDPLPVVLLISNKGVSDVRPDRLMLSWAYDPLYISAPKKTEDAFVEQTVTEQLDAVFSSEDRDTLLKASLHGRSAIYPQGEQVSVEEYEISTNKILGSRQHPITELSAMVCYEYKTVLAQGVCVDVDNYLRTGREQACQGDDLSLSSQGGPVAFTYIEMRTNPVSTGSEFHLARPEFIVTLRNLGEGIVVSPPKNDFEKACGLQGLSTQELGAVRVNGTLFNLPLECSPEVVRFRNGEAKTRCTIRDVDLGNPVFAITQNVMAVLQLEASYIYRSSISSEITIVANPIFEGEGFVADVPIKQGYVYDEQGLLVRDPQTGLSQIKCDVYAREGRVPPSDPRIAAKKLTPDWSCACSKQQCAEMDTVGGVGDTRSGFCTYGLCPESSYCCDKQGYESFKKAANNNNGENS